MSCGWAILPIARSHGLSGRRLLDVGCGKGKSFLPMLARGWKVTACDISPSMLEIARAKAGDAVDLSVAPTSPPTDCWSSATVTTRRRSGR
jgi:ubiquinone/menaquinone biosynthesis C-methylase UbiE